MVPTISVRFRAGQVRENLSGVLRIMPSGAGTLALLFGLCFLPVHSTAHAHERPALSAEFDIVACYGLVKQSGRAIAWARWEKGLSLEKTRAAPFATGTPVWVVDLVKAWIDDAYQWRPTDQQIEQWAAELGSVDDLPGVDALSVHETIAIWMRRIGRQCGERELQATVSAAPTGMNSREVQ